MQGFLKAWKNFAISLLLTIQFDLFSVIAAYQILQDMLCASVLYE